MGGPRILIRKTKWLENYPYVQATMNEKRLHTSIEYDGGKDTKKKNE